MQVSPFGARGVGDFALVKDDLEMIFFVLAWFYYSIEMHKR